MIKKLTGKYMFLYISIAVVILFSGFYFITINKISYAFSDSSVNFYEEKIKSIANLAKTYAEYNPDIFGEEDYVYFTVSELVEKGVLVADTSNGDVLDPADESKTLNDLKVKITSKDGKIEAKVLN